MVDVAGALGDRGLQHGPHRCAALRRRRQTSPGLPRSSGQRPVGALLRGSGAWPAPTSSAARTRPSRRPAATSRVPRRCGRSGRPRSGPRPAAIASSTVQNSSSRRQGGRRGRRAAEARFFSKEAVRSFGPRSRLPAAGRSSACFSLSVIDRVLVFSALVWPKRARFCCALAVRSAFSRSLRALFRLTTLSVMRCVRLPLFPGSAATAKPSCHVLARGPRSGRGSKRQAP